MISGTIQTKILIFSGPLVLFILLKHILHAKSSLIHKTGNRTGGGGEVQASILLRHTNISQGIKQKQRLTSIGPVRREDLVQMEIDDKEDELELEDELFRQVWLTINHNKSKIIQFLSSGWLPLARLQKLYGSWWFHLQAWDVPISPGVLQSLSIAPPSPQPLQTGGDKIR